MSRTDSYIQKPHTAKMTKKELFLKDDDEQEELESFKLDKDANDS